MSKEGKSGVSSGKKIERETKAPILRQAVMRRLPQRLSANAEFRLPPVPALLEHYTQVFNNLWVSIGRVFSAADLDQFRAGLKQNLERAWAASPYSAVKVSFSTIAPPGSGLNWNVDVETQTMADEYAYWVKTRTPPLFGKHPDAKVLDLARSLGVPAETPILDVGAGTGRNTLPLSRAGFPTDAVEMAPALAAILREEVANEGRPVQVFEHSILDPNLPAPAGHYRLVFLAEVVSHFRTFAELRALFEVAARLLPAGGLLLFSTFLSSDGYKPDDVVREMSEVLWCKLFTRRELDDAVDGQPFQRVSDESVPGYEKANLPAEAWPPTGWFETWSGGQDLFDLPVGKPPMELRWLVYRKTS